jgi:hypothetical protein
MPPRVRVVAPQPTIVVPEEVGRALLPELDRDNIPTRRTMAGDSPPFAGELREAQFSYMRRGFPLAIGASFTAATLRRAWPLVGFTVNPGNAEAPGLVASLRVLGRGISGTIATVVVPPGLVTSFVGFLVGARCELVITNPDPGGGTATGVGGEIWGMPTSRDDDAGAR